MVSICAIAAGVAFCKHCIGSSVYDILIGAVCHGQLPDALLCKDGENLGAFQRMDVAVGGKTQTVPKSHGGSFFYIGHRSCVGEEAV